MRLLLIDDDINCIKNLKDALEPGGYECSIFQNPIDGINAFKEDNFDVVITDFKMSQMNGIEVLKAIRTHDSSAYVIILSGFADVDNAIAAVNNGACGFFRKPINFYDIMSALQKIEKELSEYKIFKQNFDSLHKTVNKLACN